MKITTVLFVVFNRKTSMMKRLSKTLIVFAALFSCLEASAQQTTILPLTSSDLFKAADNYQKGLYDKAFETFKALSENCDAHAIYGLGVCYYNGKGTTKDLNEAIKCFDKSYRWGNKSAAFILGKCYLYGHGTSKDFEKAEYCLTEAANQGNLEAKTLLSKITTERAAEIEKALANIEMVFVEGGTFQMGATSEQGSDAYYEEKPVHTVTVSSFYIGKTEVTQELWVAVMGSNPSYFKKGGNYPVESVSWNDVQEFLKKLNAITGKQYRLPTEAEWEYAARGGNKSRGYKYSGGNNIEDIAWYEGNSSQETHPIATKAPNELGIYDMSGNVMEWCQDWYNSEYYSQSPSNNPQGASSGINRVLRGGSWDFIASFSRVSYRDGQSSDNGVNLNGVRLVLLP